MTNIIFMGTPDFSATVLKGLLESKQYEILAVVTQPDRAVGRKKRNPYDTSQAGGCRSSFSRLSARKVVSK